jgi:HSP20 family protein
MATGANDTPPSASFANRTMLTLRTASPFDLFDRIEQQLSQQLQSAERVPAAEVHESADAFEVVLELPGVDKAAIEVKATDRTLVISAERRSQGPQAEQPHATADRAKAEAGPLLSEFRYGTWSRSFRFPSAIERDQLKATYRDGLLTITAPKAQTVSTVSVQVEG